MVWRVEKNGQRAYLVGTAHFFPYSFAGSLTRLLQRVDTVMFEGPLDDDSTARIAEYGRQGDHVSLTLAEALEPEAIKEINRLLAQRFDHKEREGLLLLLQPVEPNYFELYTRGVRPWAAFFFLWQACLNWPYSVDLEGYKIAQRLGKNISFLETIEEQLAVLDGIPFERIVRQLNQVGDWPRYTDYYVDHFLEGKLDELMALTDRFITRGRPAIMDRDYILFDRMKPIFDREAAVAFIGFPHVPGVTRLFLEQGYRITQGVE
jgi:uncharacterized protein YbaP (TraB family)